MPDEDVLPAFLYDWNQDGAGDGLCGWAAADGRPPSLGDRVVLYGDGLAVVTEVTEIDGGFFRTSYAASRARG